MVGLLPSHRCVCVSDFHPHHIGERFVRSNTNTFKQQTSMYTIGRAQLHLPAVNIHVGHMLGFPYASHEYLNFLLSHLLDKSICHQFYLFLLCVEIAELEQNSRLVSGPDSGFVVGPAAELAQLAAAPWPQLLEANRARQQDLLKERERHQFAVERVTGQLEKAR